MKSLWNFLSTKEIFKETIFVPCDSHGLQLLIKDIVTMPEYVETLGRANLLVSHFRSAHKQLALLRHYQRECYNKTMAFTLAAETRWGTQVYLLNSISRSRDALRAFRRDRDNDCKNNEILDIIVDEGFWADVADLLDILRPIHKLQIQSESSRGHLGHVLPRWKTIREALASHAASSALLELFDKRFKQQIDDIHVLAYHLDPVNAGVAVGTEMRECFNTMRTYTSRETYLAIKGEFLNFKKQRDVFAKQAYADLWEEEIVSRPKDFWEMAECVSGQLAAFARRLYGAPPNSVPSERAFSAMKLQHTRLRTRLSLDRIDKLTFIFVNQRTLHVRTLRYKTKLYELTEEEELEEEDEMLEKETEVIPTKRARDDDGEGLAEDLRPRQRFRNE
jgi:hypothetical protein